MSIKRHHFVLYPCAHPECCGECPTLESEVSDSGSWVYHADHLADRAAAVAAARREALEEAVDQVKCLISCVNAGPRFDGEEWYVVDTLEDAIDAIRALAEKEASRE